MTLTVFVAAHLEHLKGLVLLVSAIFTKCFVCREWHGPLKNLKPLVQLLMVSGWTYGNASGPLENLKHLLPLLTCGASPNK